jgi:Na+/glutamate symporter
MIIAIVTVVIVFPVIIGGIVAIIFIKKKMKERDFLRKS